MWWERHRKFSVRLVSCHLDHFLLFTARKKRQASNTVIHHRFAWVWLVVNLTPPPKPANQNWAKQVNNSNATMERNPGVCTCDLASEYCENWNTTEAFCAIFSETRTHEFLCFGSEKYTGCIAPRFLVLRKGPPHFVVHWCEESGYEVISQNDLFLHSERHFLCAEKKTIRKENTPRGTRQQMTLSWPKKYREKICCLFA